MFRTGQDFQLHEGANTSFIQEKYIQKQGMRLDVDILAALI